MFDGLKQLYGVGQNTYGQLLTDSKEPVVKFTKLPTVPNVSKVVCGGMFTVFLTGKNHTKH